MEWGRVAGFALAAGASLLAGCAADSPILEQLMVVPGYYDTLSCPELVAKLRSATERVRELILLMEKSGEDSTGAIVNAVAYNTEYAKARSTQACGGGGGAQALRSQRRTRQSGDRPGASQVAALNQRDRAASTGRQGCGLPKWTRAAGRAGGTGQTNQWYFNTIPAVCCFIATVKGAPLL